MRLPTALRASARTPFLQVVKTSIAIIVAWFVGYLIFPAQVPFFAAIAALLCVQPNVNQSVGRAIERSLGVVAGVIVAYLAGLVFGNESWLVILAIVVSMLAAWGFRLTAGSGNQMAISAMLVISIGDTNAQYATDRIIETIIGAAIGVGVNVLVVAPVLVEPAHAAVSKLTRAAASALDRLAGALVEPRDREWLSLMLTDARALRSLRDDAEGAIEKGRESLALNPRGSRHRARLDADQETFERVEPIVTQLVGMTRGVHDNYDRELPGESTVRGIAVELGRAAHDLRLLAPDHVPVLTSDRKPTSAESPALTAPLVIGRPSPDHWILIGSLVEDLRRVREGIVAAESDD